MQLNGQQLQLLALHNQGGNKVETKWSGEITRL